MTPLTRPKAPLTRPKAPLTRPKAPLTRPKAPLTRPEACRRAASSWQEQRGGRDRREPELEASLSEDLRRDQLVQPAQRAQHRSELLLDPLKVLR